MAGTGYFDGRSANDLPADYARTEKFFIFGSLVELCNAALLEFRLVLLKVDLLSVFLT